MSQAKLTFKTSSGSESSITGNVRSGPTPRIYPPIHNIIFTQFKTDGDLWGKDEFDIESGKVEYKGKIYLIPNSKVSNQKDGDKIQVMIHTHGETNGEGLPFFG